MAYKMTHEIRWKIIELAKKYHFRLEVDDRKGKYMDKSEKLMRFVHESGNRWLVNKENDHEVSGFKIFVPPDKFVDSICDADISIWESKQENKRLTPHSALNGIEGFFKDKDISNESCGSCYRVKGGLPNLQKFLAKLDAAWGNPKAMHEYENGLGDEIDDGDPIANQHEKAIKGRTDIGATTKEQLVKSRRGQGVFRSNVWLNEMGCRVTGVTDPHHLRASHIKPWKDSTDEEKLDGCNGLLLSPHIDHLFDKGHITFTNNGDLRVSPRMDRAVLAKWGILVPMNVGPFNTSQSEFLDYHRRSVFKK